MWHISDFGSVKQKDILWHAESAVSSLENLKFNYASIKIEIWNNIKYEI